MTCDLPSVRTVTVSGAGVQRFAVSPKALMSWQPGQWRIPRFFPATSSSTSLKGARVRSELRPAQVLFKVDVSVLYRLVTPIVLMCTLRRIMEQFRMLTELQSKWVDFDTAGKELYLEQVRRVRTIERGLKMFELSNRGHTALRLPQMRSFTERLGIYITRCKLSDDPGAKAMIHQLNIGYLNAGLDIGALHGGCAIPQGHMTAYFNVFHDVAG